MTIINYRYAFSNKPTVKTDIRTDIIIWRGAASNRLKIMITYFPLQRVVSGLEPGNLAAADDNAEQPEPGGDQGRPTRPQPLRRCSRRLLHPDSA